MTGRKTQVRTRRRRRNRDLPRSRTRWLLDSSGVGNEGSDEPRDRIGIPKATWLSGLGNQWLREKVRGQHSRGRRIAIVAMARKLLLALWKYAMHGEVPRGARFKSPEQKRRLRKTASLGAVDLKVVA